jgi:hypothetical protein
MKETNAFAAKFGRKPFTQYDFGWLDGCATALSTPVETTARKAEYFDIFPAMGCNRCPWDLGDSHVRDCDFPNCTPAWKPSEESTPVERMGPLEVLQRIKLFIDDSNSGEEDAWAMTRIRRLVVAALEKDQPTVQTSRELTDQKHYPEEWGPSGARRLTCVCGHSDPGHMIRPASVIPHLDTCGLKYGGPQCTCGLTPEESTPTKDTSTMYIRTGWVCFHCDADFPSGVAGHTAALIHLKRAHGLVELSEASREYARTFYDRYQRRIPFDGLDIMRAYTDGFEAALTSVDCNKEDVK